MFVYLDKRVKLGDAVLEIAKSVKTGSVVLAVGLVHHTEVGRGLGDARERCKCTCVQRSGNAVSQSVRPSVKDNTTGLCWLVWCVREERRRVKWRRK
jgi:hypothetical protein